MYVHVAVNNEPAKKLYMKSSFVFEDDEPAWQARFLDRPRRLILWFGLASTCELWCYPPFLSKCFITDLFVHIYGFQIFFIFKMSKSTLNDIDQKYVYCYHYWSKRWIFFPVQFKFVGSRGELLSCSEKKSKFPS